MKLSLTERGKKMINLSPDDFLPENYEKLKSCVPNLKIAPRLSANNPLKPVISSIENHQRSGQIFKTVVILLLLYLTVIVAVALFQHHPSAWAMVLLLLPVYGVATLSWNKSPLMPSGLAQLLPPYRIYPVLRKAAENICTASKQKTVSKKKIRLTLWGKFFLKCDFGCVKTTKSQAAQELLEIRRQINRTITDRIIIFVSLLGFAVCYYQIAFYLSDTGYRYSTVWADFISDLTFAGASFSPRIFATIYLLSLVIINFIAYAGNIFLPYENAEIKKYVMGQPQGSFERFIYIPLLKIIIFFSCVIILALGVTAVSAFYSGRIVIPEAVSLSATFVAFFILFHYLFKFTVVLLRKISLLLDYFYQKQT